MERPIKTAIVSLSFNTVCGAYHVFFGGITRSWWLLTVGVYYCMLSSMRFVIVCSKKSEGVLARFTGRMLMLLSLPLVGTVVLAAMGEGRRRLHEVTVIGVAVYAFTKILLATVKLIRSRKNASQKIRSLRNVSFSTACVSVFSLQRTMLTSLGDMTEAGVLWLNVTTGTCVCVIVFWLGFRLVRERRMDHNAHIT